MKLKKESKIRILEDFYSLDYTLFGKPVTEIDVCCPSFIDEFLSVKGALMSVVIEMYQLIKHSPNVVTEKIDTATLMKNARKSAVVARENCQKLVTSSKGRKEVKETLRESLSKTNKDVDIEQLVHEKIRTKAFSLAVDNLLIGRAITESKKFDKLNTWNGRILEDAYKILRDNLVESAMTILEVSQPVSKKKVVNELSIGTKVAGAAAAGALSYGGVKLGLHLNRSEDRYYNDCIEQCRQNTSTMSLRRKECEARCIGDYKERKKKVVSEWTWESDRQKDPKYVECMRNAKDNYPLYTWEQGRAMRTCKKEYEQRLKKG
jgi:hypothetical protein